MTSHANSALEFACDTTLYAVDQLPYLYGHVAGVAGIAFEKTYEISGKAVEVLPGYYE